MRFRVRKPKLATVHQLPVTSRIQRSGPIKVPVNAAQPLTRQQISAAVYQLPDAWGYMIVIDGDIAEVHAMNDPICYAASEVFLASNLPTVVQCLMIAQGTG